jgi:hypothetical protein
MSDGKLRILDESKCLGVMHHFQNRPREPCKHSLTIVTCGSQWLSRPLPASRA